MSTHEHGAMAPTALMSTNEHLWAWRHGAFTTHSALAPYLSVLISVHKGLCMLMSAHACSWVFLCYLKCSSSWFSNLRKMLTFKMTSFKYFVNISVKISPNSNKLDSLKNYTKRAVEKSVPIWLSDYISTCWEISVSLLAVFVHGGCEVCACTSRFIAARSEIIHQLGIRGIHERLFCY